MPQSEAGNDGAPPKLPWSVTVALLVVVIIVALIRPSAPHGIIDYLSKLAGRSVSLDIGHERSLRLVEEPAIRTGCQVADVYWSPDGTTLVSECPKGLQAWTLDGHLIASQPADNGWPQKHVQILANPFRVIYLSKAGDSGVNEAVLMTWDVGRDKISTKPYHPSAIDNFTVAQDVAKVAVVNARGRDRGIALLSPDDGQIVQTIHLQAAARSLRWLPGAQKLLLGSYDGVLRLADISTGDVRELATPYATKFSTGGGASGSVDGLVLAPDGKSVATFMTSGGIYPTPGSNFVDYAADKKWAEELGTGVEIRSVEDGRLLDRMPGRESAGARDLAWDPLDRFIAVAGGDALYLWATHSGVVTLRTYDDPGIVHTLAITNDGVRLALTTVNGLRIFRIEESSLRGH